MITISMQYFGNKGAASGKSGGAGGKSGGGAQAQESKTMNATAESLKNFSAVDEAKLSKELDALPDGTKLYTGQEHIAPEGTRQVFWEKEGNYWNYLGTGSGYGYKDSYNLIDKELYKIQSNKKYNPRLVR